MIKNHQLVKEEEYADLGFPSKDQIQNIHFEAMVRNLTRGLQAAI